MLLLAKRLRDLFHQFSDGDDDNINNNNYYNDYWYFEILNGAILARNNGLNHY